MSPVPGTRRTYALKSSRRALGSSSRPCRDQVSTLECTPESNAVFPMVPSRPLFPMLRRRQPDAEAFRLPGGTLCTVLALAFTTTLVTRMDLQGFAVIASTFAIASVNWWWAEHKPFNVEAER